MTRFLYSEGTSAILNIRYTGCNRLPHTVNISALRRDSYIIHYVTKGRGTFNGVPVRKGQGFLICPGMVAEYLADPSDPWELFWVVSEDPHMDRIMASFSADENTGVFSYDYAAKVQEAGDALMLLPERLVSAAEMLHLFLDVFENGETAGKCEKNRSGAAVSVDIARETIRSDLRRMITVEDLTETLGVSQPYLYRIFRKETGMSPREYLSRTRMMEARKLLSETDLSVTEIAKAVGYCDVMTFSRFFSGREGVSPSEYRRRSAELLP